MFGISSICLELSVVGCNHNLKMNHFRGMNGTWNFRSQERAVHRGSK